MSNLQKYKSYILVGIDIFKEDAIENLKTSIIQNN